MLEIYYHKSQSIFANCFTIRNLIVLGGLKEIIARIYYPSAVIAPKSCATTKS